MNRPAWRAWAVAGALATSPAALAAQQSTLAPGLALATFDTAWVRIDRTFYDTTFLATRWKVLRDSLRPIAARAQTNNELRAVLQSLIASVGVSHFGLIPNELSPAVSDVPASGTIGAERGMIGASLRLASSELVVWRVDTGGPAWNAGVRPGQRVLRIGHTNISDEIAQLVKIEDEEVRRQTQLTAVMRANSLLAGDRGDTLELALQTRDGEKVARVEQGPIRGQMLRFGNLPPIHATVQLQEKMVQTSNGARRIGVLAFSVWLPTIARDIDRAFDRLRQTDGIIIDLRGNPGGLGAMVSGVAGHVLDSAYMIGTLRQRAQTLKFNANPRRVSSDPTPVPVTPFAGPVAIIMDPLSGSTSEFFAAGLQGLGRARIFGEVSAGRALPALMQRLPNNDVLMHVVADLTDSQGRRVEGVGVVPDEPVPLRVEDLEAGRDAAMEAAVRWIALQGKRSGW